ncbi:MAG: hypothetical protein GC192_17550 [Bacteroidetes bacterium]|nr:hypothetical protein [Bacteroidota bacterium]
MKAPRQSFAQSFCSKRFGYCLDYPASMFPNSYFSPDEDSVVFRIGDTLGLLTVISTLSDKKLDSHLAFEQRLRDMTATGGSVNILSITNGDDYYEVNFLYGDHWYHQKAGFFRNYDVLFTIKVPVNRPEMMMRMKEDVKIEF